jgi:hypothetical protein
MCGSRKLTHSRVAMRKGYLTQGSTSQFSRIGLALNSLCGHEQVIPSLLLALQFLTCKMKQWYPPCLYHDGLGQSFINKTERRQSCRNRTTKLTNISAIQWAILPIGQAVWLSKDRVPTTCAHSLPICISGIRVVREGVWTCWVCWPWSILTYQ